jgi:hypothetical protein
MTTVWHKKIKKRSKPNWGRKWVQAEACQLEEWSTGWSKEISNKRNESTPHTQQKREVHTNKILNEAHAHKGSPPPPRRTTTTNVGLQLYEKEAQLGGLTTRAERF